MEKIPVISIIACVLTAALLAFTLVYDAKDKTAEKVDYSVVFNAATIESKLVGKHYNEITRRYLPAAETTRGKKRGSFQARYKDIKVFTRGDAHIIYGMTVSFRDSVATALTLDEPSAKKRLDARVLNLNPLAFKLIDAEIGTRDLTPDRGSAKGWGIPLLLLLALVVFALWGVGWFFLVWPLVMLCTFHIKIPWGSILSVALMAAAAWVWFPFLAYSQGHVGLYLLVGIPAFLFIVYRIWPEYDDTFDHIGPRREDDQLHDAYLIHMNALVYYIRALRANSDFSFSFDSTGWDKDYFPCLRRIGERTGVSERELRQIVDAVYAIPEDEFFSHSLEIMSPQDQKTKDELFDDYVRIIACHANERGKQMPAFYRVMEQSIEKTLGGEYASKFVYRVDAMARDEYGWNFPIQIALLKNYF